MGGLFLCRNGGSSAKKERQSPQWVSVRLDPSLRGTCVTLNNMALSLIHTFTVFDHWEALVKDYSEAQFQGLCQAVRTFLSNEGRPPTEILTFIDKVFQGCLVHWFHSAQRVAAIATGDADQQSICLRDCHRLPKVSELERKKIRSNFLPLFPCLKRWVKWWRQPHIEALLCHMDAKHTLQEWLSRPLDTNTAESHNYIAQMDMKASLTPLFD